MNNFKVGDKVQILNSVNMLTNTCHNASKNAGWWKDKNGNPIQENPLTFSNKLILTIGELTECMEADRKDAMDDHLPHRKGTEVELADAIIRIFDLAGAYGLDVAGALVEKMEYNTKRQDHKLETRNAKGGKKY